MDTCLELITDQVKLLESELGMDVVRILHHACSKSVGVTLKKGSWVSTNDVTSVVKVVGHHIRILTMYIKKKIPERDGGIENSPGSRYFLKI